MEAAAAWGPRDFQQANWTVEEPAAEVWAPASGLPVEYASIVDIFGNFSLQADGPNTLSSSIEQQLVEYNYYATASRRDRDRSHKVTQNTGDDRSEAGNSESESPHHSDHGVDVDTTEKSGDNSRGPAALSPESIVDIDGLNTEPRISIDGQARAFFKRAAGEFSARMMMKEKMHRYPASLTGYVDERYMAPMIVSIGPYHRHLEHLKPAEEAKHAAAYHCLNESGSLLEVVYPVLVDAADDARRLYDPDFMLMRCDDPKLHPSMRRFLSPNRSEILHDVLLLENQIPWRVVEAIMRFRRVSLDKFLASLRGCLSDRKLPQPKQDVDLVLDDDKGDEPPYRPPHLLGLLRHYIVGRGDPDFPRPETKKRSVTHSAMELEEMGIKLTSNSTGKLIDMQLNHGILFAELSLASLSLDRDRASYLVNMAALELCTVESFSEAGDEDSAVCSYLLLLAMLAYREEDVHEMRVTGLLHGGGGLTNQEALAFFTSLQGLRLGRRYTGIMRQIESFREKKRTETKVHAFLYNHWKTVAAVGSAIAGISGVIGTLASIKSGL
nr:unnamed protein product [Digitaria exilis]